MIGINWFLKYRLLKEELDKTKLQKQILERRLKKYENNNTRTTRNWKTTTLLNLVDEFIKQGIKPREIGYFSFSKKAATEAATRAAQKFELSPEHDLVYFRTIHSLCFKLLSMTRDRMMSPEDYKEFGIKCNIPIKTASYSEEDGIFNSDNEYLTIINTARVKGMDLLECYDSRKKFIRCGKKYFVFNRPRIEEI